MPGLSSRLRGYSMASTAYVLMGAVGALVAWAQAPESMMVVLRMGMAAAILGVFIGRASVWREVRRPGILRLVLVMGAVDAGALTLLFIAIRLTGVAVAMFLMFLSPVWVALLAPVVMKQPTDRIVWPSLGLALTGLGFVIVPQAIGSDMPLSFWGVVLALLAGLFMAAWMMSVSALRSRGLGSTAIVLSDCTLVALLVLPLGVWQTWAAGDGLTARDMIAVVLMATVCTAFAQTLWTEGVGLIPVQHVPILGFLTPLSAPLYAFLIVSEVPSVWTILGGVLIVAAGSLIVLFGSRRTVEEEAAAPGP